MRPGLSLIFNLALSGRARFAQLVRRVCTTGRGHRLILFGFLSQSSKTKAVAVVGSVPQGPPGGHGDAGARRGDLARFREVFYGCWTARADAQFELTDAVLCADGLWKNIFCLRG